MNLFTIAVRNLLYRKLPTSLTILSMALGVALVVVVLTISGVVEKTFERTSNVGYNLIAGAKGNSMQLTFNTVFFLSQPVENVPYSHYLEYLPGNERQAEIQRIGGNVREPDRPGAYANLMAGGFAIPLCMGDYVGSFRCIGTTPSYFALLKHGDANDQDYSFRQGRNFVDYSKEHGYFEAVIGSQVASEMKLGIGDKIYASHGVAGGEEHDQAFHIVGVLAPTGTPNDRGAFVNIEGFLLLEGHAAPERDAETGLEVKGTAVGPKRLSALSQERLPIDKREVTAILLKPQGFNAIYLQKQVNKSSFAQAISPISEINGILSFFIKPIKWALLALTSMVCLVSAISILVSIYNSMNERKRDIAVMRALGASRDRVTLIILIESVLICLIGGALGWIMGHMVGPLANPWTESKTGIRLHFLNINSTMEIWIIPGLLLIGMLAGTIPSINAYRVSVAKSL
jgi:putative ABC transport system permease protein